MSEWQQGQMGCSEAGAFATRSAVSGDVRDRLIVALDVRSGVEALEMVERLEGQCRWLKLGMELFYAEGRTLVQRLREAGYSIFLDLKLHDIPNTVASAVKTLRALDVQLLTLHAGGGETMMRSAVESTQGVGNAPALLGVTVLTSLDDDALRSVGVTDAAAVQVERLARLTQRSGLKGLVCSPLEVKGVREAVGPEMILVTPGIRPEGSARDDQSRVATPASAIRDGASLLVVGRPITRAADPAQAAEAILKEIGSALPRSDERDDSGGEGGVAEPERK